MPHSDLNPDGSLIECHVIPSIELKLSKTDGGISLISCSYVLHNTRMAKYVKSYYVMEGNMNRVGKKVIFEPDFYR